MDEKECIEKLEYIHNLGMWVEKESDEHAGSNQELYCKMLIEEIKSLNSRVRKLESFENKVTSSLYDIGFIKEDF